MNRPVYGPGYWGRYPNWRYHWANYNNNWWAWATAGAITGWWVGGRSQPIYYDYGSTTYYEGDNVYHNDTVIASTDEYAAQAQDIASNVPDVDPDTADWLPLGVFALSPKDESPDDATFFLQLAISKEGVIAGSFQNTSNNNAFEVEGTVDQESQRAAWGPVGENWPIMETGIYNLTENQADALVHFEDGQTQQWSMSRMDESESRD